MASDVEMFAFYRSIGMVHPRDEEGKREKLVGYENSTEFKADFAVVEVDSVAGGLQQYFRELIEQARGGNVDAAKRLLDDFAKSAENIRSFRDPAKAWGRGPISWEVADYFASAFRAILEGAAPERALNIVGKTKGRRKGASRTHDEKALAASFWVLVRKGLRPEKAKTALQEKLGANRTTVDRARLKHEAFEYQQLINDEILGQIAEPYDAAIREILAAYSSG